MFEDDYTINGKHATYIKFFNDKAKLYSTYIDVYMNAAVFGLLHDRRAPKDQGADRARIYADAFSKRRDTCVFLYRLVMLLSKKDELPDEERINRAFRDDTDDEHPEKLKENMELFNSYVRGGLEVMYEKFIETCDSNDDYIDHAIEEMEFFADEILDKGDYEYAIQEFL